MKLCHETQPSTQYWFFFKAGFVVRQCCNNSGSASLASILDMGMLLAGSVLRKVSALATSPFLGLDAAVWTSCLPVLFLRIR
ncbi:hypothetical protein EYF80_009863 [Liparis tanakae]|uniref:Uncharacterized protein n=1 Tax=Liparis tanakae TaxID=230148 RepID=A0A4Z2IPN2_9TELE|nr:hypothetical protein EYF80_009863 [Liparis tanakae]